MPASAVVVIPTGPAASYIMAIIPDGIATLPAEIAVCITNFVPVFASGPSAVVTVTDVVSVVTTCVTDRLAAITPSIANLFTVLTSCFSAVLCICRIGTHENKSECKRHKSDLEYVFHEFFPTCTYFFGNVEVPDLTFVKCLRTLQKRMIRETASFMPEGSKNRLKGGTGTDNCNVSCLRSILSGNYNDGNSEWKVEAVKHQALCTK